MTEQTKTTETPRQEWARVERKRRAGRHMRAMAFTDSGIAPVVAWLKNEIAYLQSIDRTEFGDGRLSAFSATLKELEKINV